MDTFKISDLIPSFGFIPVNVVTISFQVGDGDNDFESIDVRIKIDEMSEEIFTIEEVDDWNYILTDEEKTELGNEILKGIKDGKYRIPSDLSFDPHMGTID